MFLAHVVQLKGADVERNCGRIMKDLETLGLHSDVVPRGGQARAIMSLWDEVCCARAGTRTVAESPPTGITVRRTVRKIRAIHGRGHQGAQACIGDEVGDTVICHVSRVPAAVGTSHPCSEESCGWC